MNRESKTLLPILKQRGLRPLMLVVLLGMVSCDKEASEKPGRATRSRVLDRKIARISSDKESNGSNHGIGVSAFEEPASNQASFYEQLMKQDDATIAADLRKLIESSTLTPNSENAGKAKDALKALLIRKSAEFYAMLSLLPPGYYSEMIVQQVFMEAHLGLEDVRATMDKIKEPDLLKSAVNGAFLPDLESHGTAWNIGIAELENFQKMGLSDQHFAALLTDGFNSKIYSLEDVARNTSSNGNSVVNSLQKVLTPEQLKEYSLLVYKNGRKLDHGSLFMLGLSMVHGGGAEAVAWAQQLPEEAGREAISGVFSEWMAADPRTASKTLAQMDEGILKDAATLALVRNCIANHGLEDAANWAAQIKNAGIRSEAQKLVQKAPPVR
jgi:hypothetical protein